MECRVGVSKHTMTSVIGKSTVVGEESHCVIRINEVGVLFRKLYSNTEESKGTLM
jgi:hypothetical protein